MNYAAQSVKLAELRARTDRDLLLVVTREIEAIREQRYRRSHAACDRVAKVRSLLDVVETSPSEKLRLAREIESLQTPCEQAYAVAGA